MRKQNKNPVLMRWILTHQKEKKDFRQNPTFYPLKARICGYLAGDGSVVIRKERKSASHYYVKFYPDNKFLVNSFLAAFKIVYGKKPKVRKMGNFFEIVCYSKPIVEDLLKITKFGLYEWRAPYKILRSLESKREWLRAIFDSEGYVGKKYIRIQTTNKNGIMDIKKLLKSFGIESKFYEYTPKNMKWNKVYMLFIIRRRDIINFLREVGFTHPIKLSKLKQLAQVAEPG